MRPLLAEMRANLALALPLAALHAGQQAMYLVDAAMVGRLGPAALGGSGIGGNLFMAVAVIGMGVMLGLDPLVSQAVGAGEHDRAFRWLRHGARIGLWVSLPLGALLAAAPLVLPLIGVERETAREAASYVWGRLPGLPPFVASVALRSYLQATSRTRPILVSVAVANVVNVPANAVLIYGDGALTFLGLPPLGLPALGVLGSALASSLANVVGLGVLALGCRKGRPASTAASRLLGDVRMTITLLGLGAPIGLQLLAEVGVFALAALICGKLGKLPAAGHALAVTMASFTFGVAVGVGAATGVRVGQAVGRGDAAAVRRAGLGGLCNTWLFMGVAAAALLLLPARIAGALTPDPAAVAAAVPLLRVAALFQLSDGTQAVSAGALRGAGDTRFSMLANLFGHYLIGLPIALRFGLFGSLGATGVWLGLTAGLTAVAVSLLRRFLRISRGEIARV